MTALPSFVLAAAVTPTTQPATAKPWTRWWWPGNAVDKVSLTRQLEAISAAGFGGVEVTPIYGVQGEDEREIEFLSPRYMEMLAHAASEAKRLGMQLDMATGTGWPFGGPTITPEDADARLVLEDGRISSKPTGMKVKRAAPGGAGLVVNPFSAETVQRYLAWFDAPFSDFPSELIRAQFHDSFEYAGNWTDDLPARFKAARGYDLHNHAAALAGQGDPAKVAQVKYDYRRTLDELHLEFVEAWVDWCHKNNWLARNQGHGAPANLLDLYALADIPETETFGSGFFPIPGFRRDADDIGKDSPQPLMARFASSAAHVTGKPLVACETFTWLREHFKSSLAMMKPEVDRMLLCGINHVIYHGTCFSPADAKWPGWHFYASVEFARQMPIWRDLPALNAYIDRVQSALQSGRPDNDVLVYFPIHDFWMDPEGMDVRFTMHATDRLVRSEFGRTVQDLIARGYAVDFISDRQLMEARRDGDVIVTRGGGRYAALVVPKTSHTPAETLTKIEELSAGLSLDRARRETLMERGIEFIRRSHDDGHTYFLANLTDRPVDEMVTLAAPFAAAEIRDPLTGRSGTVSQSNGIRVQLAPGESLIVRTFNKPRADKRSSWRYLESAGEPKPVTGTWQITFTDGGPTLPPPVEMNALTSWTDAGGEQAKAFSGTARYRIEFQAPADGADDWLLDLGDVRESARVTLNGQSLGTLWSLPHRTPTGGALRPGESNVLEIEVTNLAANRIRDLDRRGERWRIFKEINFVNIHYKPFDAFDWPAAPSGLLGPVTLAPLRVTTSGEHE